MGLSPYPDSTRSDTRGLVECKSVSIQDDGHLFECFSPLTSAGEFRFRSEVDYLPLFPQYLRR